MAEDINKKLGQIWDNLAKSDHIWAAVSGYDKNSFNLNKIIFANEKELPLDSIRGKKVLELGCGWGRDLIKFVLNDAKTTGLDISKEMLTKCSEYCKIYGIKPRLVHGCVDKLPFKNDSFDIVYSSITLLHCPKEKVKKAIDEIHRVLKKDGKVFLIRSFPNKFNVVRFFEDRLSQMAGRLNMRSDAYVRSYSRKELFNTFQHFENFKLDVVPAGDNCRNPILGFFGYNYFFNITAEK